MGNPVINLFSTNWDKALIFKWKRHHVIDGMHKHILGAIPLVLTSHTQWRKVRTRWASIGRPKLHWEIDKRKFYFVDLSLEFWPTNASLPRAYLPPLGMRSDDQWSLAPRICLFNTCLTLSKMKISLKICNYQIRYKCLKYIVLTQSIRYQPVKDNRFTIFY